MALRTSRPAPGAPPADEARGFHHGWIPRSGADNGP